MIPAPTWLPYRLRAAWDNRRIDAAVAGLRHARPVAACTPERAAAEVHMLVCRRDARIAALALYSLLRFDLPLAVSLTDDGSLRPADRRWIDDRVAGCRWLPRRTDDPAVRNALAARPRLSALYAGDFHMISKFLHPVLLGRTDRIILLDSDTAFFRRPDRLAEWAAGRDDRNYYLRDLQDESTGVPPEVRQGLAALAAAVTPPGRTWRLPDTFFNAGLLAYRPGTFDLDAVEGFLGWRDRQPAALRQGRPGIWFGDWTREQTAYLTAFATAAAPAEPLPGEYRLGGGAGYAFNHFLRHYLVQSSAQRQLRRLVAGLLTDVS